MVVQDTELFDPAYPTVLVVLQPSPSNGCKAKTRITAATKSTITPAACPEPGARPHH